VYETGKNILTIVLIWAWSLSQVISPLLLFCVGIDTRCTNLLLDEWALNGAHVSLTPITPPTLHTTSNDIMNVFVNIVRRHGDITLISSPRMHPGLVYRSLLLSCCQLVTSLCGLTGSCISGAVAPSIKCGEPCQLLVVCPQLVFCRRSQYSNRSVSNTS